MAKKVVIIGAGIAGLCAAVYARKCGYDVDVFEMHDRPGGLATNWRRGDYIFETCLHWLLGSKPGGTLHAQWREVFDIDKLTFVHPEEYARIETEHGESLRVASNVERMEAELLQAAPQDAVEIRRFTAAVRKFAKLPMPEPSASPLSKARMLLRLLPYFLSLRRWSALSVEAYGQRFTHPLLKKFFGDGDGSALAHLSMLALILSLAWMNDRNADYPIGGSQAIIQRIVETLERLGGRLHLGAKVAKILVEDDVALGVQAAEGKPTSADWVISAADGHETIYDLLGGAYANARIRTEFARETFPSYLQVSLGAARDFSRHAGYVTRVLDVPLKLDPDTRLADVSFRFFHFDPTFAPPGKTAITCFLPTKNFEFWVRLRERDPARYQAEKNRVAEEVIGILERSEAGIRQAIEVVDVSTPATVIRYTGNWKGSMEGWLLTPGVDFGAFRNTLPGLRRFVMVGQWVSPGGGLPSGLMTARSALQMICKEDRVTFPFGQASLNEEALAIRV